MNFLLKLSNVKESYDIILDDEGTVNLKLKVFPLELFLRLFFNAKSIAVSRRNVKYFNLSK